MSKAEADDLRVTGTCLLQGGSKVSAERMAGDSWEHLSEIVEELHDSGAVCKGDRP